MKSASWPLERFAALAAQPFVQHGFTGRVVGIDVASDKAEALRRLDRVHCGVRRSLAMEAMPFVTAEQVHGREIAIIDRPIESDSCIARCDGLITNQPGIALGIYVADCAAVFIVDPVQRAIGLVHSGKKGTQLGIVSQAIDLMGDKFGSTPADLIVQISPCIRPPHYEIDFAAEILRQSRAAGVSQIHDAGVCTACEPARYYSYRAEKGRTGRMLALLAVGAPMRAGREQSRAFERPPRRQKTRAHSAQTRSSQLS